MNRPSSSPSQPSLARTARPLRSVWLAVCAWLLLTPLQAAVPELLFSAELDAPRPTRTPGLVTLVPAGQEMILLVLQADAAGELRLLSSHRAAGRAPVRRAESGEPSLEWARKGGEDLLLFTFRDDQGEPLLVGWLDVPWELHGPYLESETGEIRCRGIRLPSVVFSPKLPVPSGSTELRLYEPTAALPSEGALLASAMRSDPETLGLTLRLALPLAEPKP